MSLRTFKPPVGPSPGTAHKPKINLYKAEFGEGYTQPTPAGINHIRKTVALRWEALLEDQMHAIIDFFELHQGTRAFYFAPYGERSPRKWTCEEWDAKTEDGIWMVTANLVQSFTHET
ncbi:phage tail protein [Ancylobacter rudongensis]|uniref:Phage-related protein n=1 Tax=Ancylobacter rudongensis TaxID=177413 RepID=A0A1G4URT7_9HYPH|nr:phage tail protein [Ancylobacter rudongensis]SCW95665.1 Phage-related protein [Ancylobacter rudongensis]